MTNPATWRFMGSYKWGYKSKILGYKYSYLTYSPTYNTTTHEPPSTVMRSRNADAEASKETGA